MILPGDPGWDSEWPKMMPGITAAIIPDAKNPGRLARLHQNWTHVIEIREGSVTGKAELIGACAWTSGSLPDVSPELHQAILSIVAERGMV